jgi:abequosyltransferase
MKYKISFCIPTYNFGCFIAETIESILAQNVPGVEIVIGDGDSRDNTELIIRGLQKSYPNIKYVKFPNKGGVDFDLAQTVLNSSGDYCWLMSADDILLPGAINKVIAMIENQGLIILCNRLVGDFQLNVIGSSPWLSSSIHERSYNFSNRSDFQDYLKNARSLGALFSFISSLIVSRSLWNSLPDNKEFYATNYAHAQKILNLSLNGANLIYIKQPLIISRSENDSFMAGGLCKRYLIDLKGFRKICNSLALNHEEQKLFKKIFRREHSFFSLVSLASKVHTDDWRMLINHFIFFQYSIIYLRFAGWLGRMILMIKLLKKLLFLNKSQ